MIQNFRDVINLWDTPDALAVDVGAKVETARKWRQRDSIPSEWWLRVVEKGRAREGGEDLTVEQLAEIVSQPQTLQHENA